jgi:hypothetical protein
MKIRSAVLIGLATFLCCSVSNASITNVIYASDYDGAIDCKNWWFDYGDIDNYALSMVGDQYVSPGHMLGTFEADSAVDPTVRMRNTLDNDTSFDWTSFHVNIYLNTTFTLSSATNYVPGDWTTVVTAPVSTGTNFMGQVDFYSGSVVAIGDTLDFGYKISFTGSTSYSFTQEFVPIPEPGTFSLAAVGGLLIGGFKLIRRRNQV